MKFRAAVKAQEALVQHRLVDDAEQTPFLFFQRDQRAPGRSAGDEGARPVDGIENPAKPARALFGAVLLAKNAIARALGADQRPHRRLGVTIGRGHRIETRLALVGDVETVAEVGADHRARRVGESVREGDGRVVRIVHLALFRIWATNGISHGRQRKLSAEDAGGFAEIAKRYGS